MLLFGRSTVVLEVMASLAAVFFRSTIHNVVYLCRARVRYLAYSHTQKAKSHYQINTHDKDYNNITDHNTVTLRGDDVLGFITKRDDVLMRFDQTKLRSDEKQLLLLERQIVNYTSFNINYALCQNNKGCSWFGQNNL